VLPALVIHFTKAVIKRNAKASGAKIVLIVFIHPQVCAVKLAVVTPLERIIDI
jgi:hypothetical protein